MAGNLNPNKVDLSTGNPGNSNWTVQVPFPEVDNPAVDNSNIAGYWAEFTIENRVEQYNSRHILGITSPGGFNSNSAVVVQLASTFDIMTVNWSSSAFGIPAAPNADEVSLPWVLLNQWMVYNAPTVDDSRGKSNPLYKGRGVIYYGNIQASSSLYRDMIIPRYPWLADVFLRAIPQSAIQTGLISPAITTTTSTNNLLGPSITR